MVRFRAEDSVSAQSLASYELTDRWRHCSHAKNMLLIVIIVVQSRYLQLGAPLRGEFAVEHDDVAFRGCIGGGGVRHLRRFSLAFDQFFQDLLLGVEVLSAADVSAVELVRVPAVDDLERGDLVVEGAAQQSSHDGWRDGFEVPVAALDQGQDVRFAEVSDEVRFRGGPREGTHDVGIVHGDGLLQDGSFRYGQ